MLEVYRPDWCETREDWSVFLFSPQNKWVTFSAFSFFSLFSSVVRSAFDDWLIASKGHWLIQILSSGHRTHLMKTITTKGVRIVFTTLSIGRTGFWAFTEKVYIRVLITTFQITNWYFLRSLLLLESEKQASGGKCDTIGNSLNFAITYGDAVLQSADRGRDWIGMFCCCF